MEIFCNYLTVEQVDDPVGKSGIVRRVGHHDDGGAILIEL